MIQTQAQLSDFLHNIENETELVIDTEFKRVNTYYPLLCLVQIATKRATDCIDVLAIKNLQPLFNKLYQQNCLWIVHSARQDIEALHCLSGRLPTQLFDTQIALDLLKDLRPEACNPSAQISYQSLTEILQGVRLEKAYTRLDWTTRPLPDGAIEYALDDVRYLIKNYHQLKIRLENEQKLEWLMEEGQSLLDVNLYEVDITQAWKRVKGISRLPKKLHNIGAQLCAWREHTAIDKNKPRKWILADDDLINIAMGKDNFNAKKQQSFESFLTQYPQRSDIKIDTQHHTPPTPAEKAQRVILQKVIQEKANQYNLTAEVIATSKILLRYIRGNQSVNFLSGWRYQILKEELENAK
ncbi:ribonuclease D [bacterium endosymbiont of Bathymodiolus sp. 5 South]|jgi:ribonuclease D|uniref:ribonuclease D n=1 Tax=bacterium endosymbiont of Bathymodiolus sp. 5 South TaxID=1181670 RepID=UPI0010B338E8|nr:ribonuclease D [bacterium endosymbiont of Bathymodiolus sp. 5 South]CAC9640258.1 Ribonuclease D (EC 3.1.26.3) [uncultured Gammaproteobacteria bacterium]SHN90547.1 Ribonuclease D [bacterium endosymbiont of Bathymodiolus sp. 5 South]SSC07060.1 Ribonuclease D [bacterium endosymbiont of Bathymodiolus sp. 5 South]VVH59590.1 Ribonuclease D (EC [uncultured Gammaproteobacteria bacterium]VVH62846.1 Ribonuclease D (EC [uncultured Gammaproteobacteria bacterium]